MLDPAMLNEQKLHLATGHNRYTKRWRNQEMTYSQLVDRLKNTTRTAETVAEYHAMTRAQRDDIKDVGGFVGGLLKEGRRSAGKVANRGVLTLDIDEVEITADEVWERVTSIFKCEIIMYSTHSHTPGRPRLRLVIVLGRPVLPDEYQAIGRRFAGNVGIDMFDDTTYEPSRLMYWPSTPIDGEYYYRRQKGPWLDPEAVLAEYEDWTDVSQWPVSSRQSSRILREMKKQEDPLEKRGLIGAFCRAYSISEVIDKYLADIYLPASTGPGTETQPGSGRYTYAAGSTVGGLVVYEDKFAFSHHGTDPISGQLCNAFDLVRIHLFGLRDEDAKENTPINRMPSYTAMTTMANQDEVVIMALGEERMAEAEEDFDFAEVADATAADDPEPEDKTWLKKLKYNDNGKLINSIHNARVIIENDPRLKDRFAFNEFAGRAVIRGKLPWPCTVGGDWSDADDAGLRDYIEKRYGISQANKVNDAFLITLKGTSFHPVREYLDSLDWDELGRIDTLLVEYLGAEDTPYIRTVTRKWLLGAVARIYQPGIKFDHMLVLTGPQGSYKSSFFRILAKDWFNDSLQDVEGNQAIEKLMNSWIIEFGELQAFSRSESNAIKRFITSQEDRTRLAYGRRTSYLKRQCVFAGTTNKADFLKDDTGNRRFWPVTVRWEGRYLDVFKDLPKWRDQIWGEAVALWKSKKETLYLTKEEEQWAVAEQEAHREINEKEGIIVDYLDTLLPDGWDRLELGDRRQFLAGEDAFDVEGEGKNKREKVCVLEIWCECFGKNRADLRKTDSLEINAILNSLDGWKTDVGSLHYFSIYGRQRAFIRKT